MTIAMKDKTDMPDRHRFFAPYSKLDPRYISFMKTHPVFVNER